MRTDREHRSIPAPAISWLSMTITMYGADWCGDCLRAKAYFGDNGIDFDYINLEETPDAAEIVLERNKGLKRIPVIVFPDDSHLTEPSNEALAAKLAALAPDVQCAIHTGHELELVDNSEEGQFELRRGDTVVSVASYSVRDSTVLIPFVGTMPEHRGQGYATRLMDEIVAEIARTERKIMPLCPFAAGYLRDRPELSDLLA